MYSKLSQIKSPMKNCILKWVLFKMMTHKTLRLFYSRFRTPGVLYIFCRETTVYKRVQEYRAIDAGLLPIKLFCFIIHIVIFKSFKIVFYLLRIFPEHHFIVPKLFKAGEGKSSGCHSTHSSTTLQHPPADCWKGYYKFASCWGGWFSTWTTGLRSHYFI